MFNLNTLELTNIEVIDNYNSDFVIQLSKHKCLSITKNTIKMNEILKDNK